jgi:hypothetical protein
VPELRLNQDSAVQTHVAKDLPGRRAPATQADSCDADRMRSDGRALPDLTQTIVLRQLGLIRTDQLPDLAARWLAADMTDTRAAIATLARLGVTYPDFDLGLFIGLDDEWNGGWGRLEPDLKAAAEQEIDHILHGQR